MFTEIHRQDLMDDYSEYLDNPSVKWKTYHDWLEDELHKAIIRNYLLGFALVVLALVLAIVLIRL